MATAGPNNPSAATGNTGSGTSWTNPTNVFSSNDARATNTMTGGGNSRILLVTGFGFAIPSGATIDGILLEIERSAQVANTVKDFSVRLTKASAAVGSNVADTGTFWPNGTDAYKSYGGATSLFGTTWSDTDVNDSGFGVAIVTSTTSAKGFQARVDHIRITVYYTAGGGGGGGTANNLLLLGVG